MSFRPDLRVFSETLLANGIGCELYGDIDAPHPAYVATYNQEMKRELERRNGKDTVHAVRQLLWPDDNDGG